ncbi:hypothetical protein PFISCL1PPCAC_29038, partial [Pristionchus fissidentatus]
NGFNNTEASERIESTFGYVGRNRDSASAGIVYMTCSNITGECELRTVVMPPPHERTMKYIEEMNARFDNAFKPRTKNRGE